MCVCVCCRCCTELKCGQFELILGTLTADRAKQEEEKVEGHKKCPFSTQHQKASIAMNVESVAISFSGLMLEKKD